jgi:hypothetical protein
MSKPEFKIGRLYDVDIMSDVDIEQGCDAREVARLIGQFKQALAAHRIALTEVRVTWDD